MEVRNILNDERKKGQECFLGFCFKQMCKGRHCKCVKGQHPKDKDNKC